MQNAIWYIVGLIAVVVVGAGAYTMMNRGGPAAAPAATSTPQTSEMSLREFSMSQTPQKCTFTSMQGSQGTVYVANARVRGDFTAQANGSAVMGHMIVKDNTSHVWMDGMSTGFKNSFDAVAEPGSATDSGVNPDERVSYSCEPWTPDDALFSLPAGVEFKSISDMQVKAGAGAVGATCSQCNMIPDATAKAQCLAALKCQ